MQPSTIITVFVLLIAGQAQLDSRAEHIANDDVSLAALCGGPGGGQQLTTRQVNSLANELKRTNAVECPAHIKAALLDLGELLERHQEDICTDENAQSIVSFYNRHLRKDDKSIASLPSSLEALALAYAMRTSQQCKLNMIKIFTSSQADGALKPEDFAALTKWTAKGGDIARLMGLIADPGAIVIPSDLAAILPEDDEIMGRLVVKGASLYVDADIRLIKGVCLRRFKPVYMDLVEPVAALSRAGFDFPDKLIKDQLPADQLQNVDKLEEWSRIVFLCETLDFVKSLANLDGDRATSGNGRDSSAGPDDNDAVKFVDALEYFDNLDEIEQALTEASRIRAGRPKLAMREVAPLPPSQLKQLIHQLDAQQTSMDLFEARLIRSKQQILQELAEEPNAEELDIGAAASFGRRQVGSIQPRDGIAWGSIIKKMGIAAVLMAAIIKMPLGPPSM